MITGRLRQLGKSVRRSAKRRFAKALVLMYHRVEQVDCDPWEMNVMPNHFAAHMEVLNKSWQPVALITLAQACREGRIPDRAVVITFDDGYSDNLHNAKPWLNKFAIPATVFITTGHIGTKEDFWWDELERLLLTPGELPAVLELPVRDRSWRWNLGTAAHYHDDEYQRDKKIVPWNGKTGSRLGFYYELYKILQPLPTHELLLLMARLREWAKTPRSQHPRHPTLTRDELLTLASGNLIDIGAHTVTHPALSAQAIEAQKDEIHQSRQILQELTKQPVSCFSYPYGDRSGNTVALIQQAGFDGACTTQPDNVWRWSDRYQLPRFNVPDCPGDEFARLLEWWYG